MSDNLSKFVQQVTLGISKSPILMDVVTRIHQTDKSVMIVAVPKSEETVEDVKEELIDRIREFPEEFGLKFSAGAQANVIGERTHLFVRLTPH